MNIIINKNTIDFKLENETKLGQILPDLLSHMADSGYFNPKVKIDGVEIGFSNNDWKDLAIDSISDLSLDARNILEIEENINIIDNALLALDGDCPDMELEKLTKEWDLFCASINFWLFDFHFDATLFKTIKELETIWTNVHKRKALSESGKSLLTLAKNALLEKSKELDNPTNQLLLTIEKLNSDADALATLGQLFQKGNDNKAFLVITSFTEHFQKFIRCNTFMDDENVAIVLTDFIKDISAKLNNLVQSLENKDFILTADIAEYEIMATLKEQLPIMETLLREKSET